MGTHTKSMARPEHCYFYLEVLKFWSPQKRKMFGHMGGDSPVCAVHLRALSCHVWKNSKNWNLRVYFIQFVPNVSVHWRWPEVYCNRCGWFKVLLISGPSKTRLVTLSFTLLQPLNLVGVKADECCTEASNFSDVLQSLYMLFSLLCLTMVVVCSKMSENDIKHLLCTEVSWCTHVEDCNAVVRNYIHSFLTSPEWFYR